MLELEKIKYIVKSVRIRLRILRALDSLPYGFGTMFGILLLAVIAFEMTWCSGDTFRLVCSLSWLSPLLGLLISQFIPVHSTTCAKLIDDTFNLKERTVRALSFLRSNSISSFEKTQIKDAARKLEGIVVREVLPIRGPRGWKVAALMFLFFSLSLLVKLPNSIDINSHEEFRRRAFINKQVIRPVDNSSVSMRNIKK